MNIAIFADLHGRILLCFKLCARWERETGQKIDLILQAGDLGVFAHESRLDKATRRYARKDPTELGFLTHFMAYDPKVAAVLAETTCPMIFVRGNHEDHDWLDELERQSSGALFAVDAYKRIFCLSSGIPYTPSQSDKAPTILGIGRTGPLVGESHSYRSQFIQPYEANRLRRLKKSRCDILLTHDSARDSVTVGYGMKEIRQTLDSFSPSYHFYGHTGRPCNQKLYSNGVTLSVKLSDLSWKRSEGGLLPSGVMGLLRWQSPDEHRFEVLDEGWIKEYSAHQWKYL